MGELFPRVGFIVTNLKWPTKRVVRFYNRRGTAEQWIKEGKNALKWTKQSCRRFKDNAARLPAAVLRGKSLQPSLRVGKLNSSSRCRGSRGRSSGKDRLTWDQVANHVRCILEPTARTERRRHSPREERMKTIPLRSRELAEEDYSDFELEVQGLGAALTATVQTYTTPYGTKYARLSDPVLSFDETETEAEKLRELARAYGFEPTETL
jgi:hypothetical protein